MLTEKTYRDIPGRLLTDPLLPAVDLAEDGSAITVEVRDAFSLVTSDPVILRVNADTVPPRIDKTPVIPIG